jgi:hypothetical protein
VEEFQWIINVFGDMKYIGDQCCYLQLRDFDNVCKSNMTCTDVDGKTLMEFWFSAVRVEDTGLRYLLSSETTVLWLFF